MELKEIERVSKISKEEFLSGYVKKRKPVIITELSKDWNATKNWNLDYMGRVVGEVEVPLYDSTPTKGTESTQRPAAIMTMGEYMEILKAGPSDLRIFFFNILQKCPVLLKDFDYPDIGLKFFKKLPTLFFGGAGSRVSMHFDMDLSHNLHFNFHGTKDITLFGPEQTKYLYKQPFSVVSVEAIEMDRPDFKNFPALQYANGYHTVLEHGEALFIPSEYWHFIRYITPSLSITLRSYPRSIPSLIRTFSNVFLVRGFDNCMRKLQGQKWIDRKNRLAKKKGDALAASLQKKNLKVAETQNDS